MSTPTLDGYITENLRWRRLVTSRWSAGRSTGDFGIPESARPGDTGDNGSAWDHSGTRTSNHRTVESSRDRFAGPRTIDGGDVYWEV
jgi:hypothetical protein